MLLAAGNVLGPVTGVCLLVVEQSSNAELLCGCACTWRVLQEAVPALVSPFQQVQYLVQDVSCPNMP